MLYSLLLCIGSLIILFFLSSSYFRSLKRLGKINYRQKTYILLIIMSFLGILFDILEGLFFTLEIKPLFMICWYSHWVTTYAFYFIIYYYFIIHFNLCNPKSMKEVFIGEKLFSLKNLYTLFVSIMFVAVLVYVRPISLNAKFEFVPFKYGIFILISMFFYALFIVDLIVKYLKTDDKNKRSKIISMTTTTLAVSISAIIQILIPNFAFLGLGLYLSIMLLYFFIENVDLIIAEELVVVKKNIEKSSNAKLDFLYNMSHDIRSPMNAIVELSKSLRQIEEFNEETVRNDIKSIKFSCNNLVEIVNNILDVNKIASGQEDLQLKEYNLNKLLADMPYVIETRIGSKPIKLEFDIDQNIASGLIGDTTKLYRVIMNILTNSVKYTEVGKIKLTIKGEINGDIQKLNMRISDTGYGIKKDDFDKMFTKFNRLDDATDNAIEGTGLGLVITKKYVDSMGGKIWFESEYGAGTIFFIELPQKIVNKTPLSQAVEGNENKKIEIVDLSNN